MRRLVAGACNDTQRTVLVRLPRQVIARSQSE
jgi:hypothetical protein